MRGFRCPIPSAASPSWISPATTSSDDPGRPLRSIPAGNGAVTAQVRTADDATQTPATALEDDPGCT